MRVFRDEVDDVITDRDGGDFGCLWSNREAYGYMTEACDAVASRTDTKMRTLRIPFVADQATVRLPAYVLDVRSMRHVERDSPVELKNANEPDYGVADDYGLSRLGGTQLFGGSGLPHTAVRDYDNKALRLVPTPNVAGTLEVQCTTTISTPLESGMPLPLTDIKDQRLVLHYMKALAYRKQDAETEDLTRAREFHALYENGVEDRKVRLRNNRRAPGVVRMTW